MTLRPPGKLVARETEKEDLPVDDNDDVRREGRVEDRDGLEVVKS